MQAALTVESLLLSVFIMQTTASLSQRHRTDLFSHWCPQIAVVLILKSCLFVECSTTDASEVRWLDRPFQCWIKECTSERASTFKRINHCAARWWAGLRGGEWKCDLNGPLADRLASWKWPSNDSRSLFLQHLILSIYCSRASFSAGSLSSITSVYPLRCLACNQTFHCSWEAHAGIY